MAKGVTLARYYDWLSRYQRVAARLRGWGRSDRLALHRRLAADRPGVEPSDVVHERLLAALGPLTAPRVIDAGCGVGATVFFLHARLGGHYHGLTLSPGQRASAVREARRRGIADACRFHVRSYDEDLGDLAPEGVDLIVAI